MRAAWLLPAALILSAQTQPTFYAAWQDGLDAEHAGLWREAAAAYRRALDLHPTPAARTFTYGNNLILGYYPRTRLAHCLVELGDLEGAEAALMAARAEPAGPREALMTRIRALRAAQAPAPAQPQPDRSPAQSRPGESGPLQLPPTPPSTPPRTGPDQGHDGSQPAPPPVSSSASSTVRAAAPVVSRPAATAEPLPLPVPATAGGPVAPEPAGPLPLPRWVPWVASLGLAALAAGLTRWVRRRKPPLWAQGSSGAMVVPPPEKVGPYRVGPLLGRGGFSSTYLAWHQETGREVALKLPHPHRLEDLDFRLRFRQEARLGAQLDHPNLVRILDPGPGEGLPYLAMEYVPGRTLDERLKDGETLPVDEARTIALDVARAMTYAHSRGVVHRDLKPGNILLTHTGARVMDLGIARVMDATTVTTTYAFLGTPLYAAPEAQLKTHVGPAADRYSLGVILFHMLAGVPPFQGETPFEVLDRHRTALPPDLQALRPEVPPVLARLVARLMDKEPDQRPEDGEVENLLAGLTPLTAPPEAVPRH